MLLKITVPTIAMILVLSLFNHFVVFDVAKKFTSIVMIAVNALIGGTVYVAIAYKMGIFDEVFGRAYMNKLIKKLTFGKVSLKG